MRGFLGFLKTTAMGGFFVVAPVSAAVFLVYKAASAAIEFVRPYSEDGTVREVGGLWIAGVLTVAIVLGVSFVTGLFVRTRIGARATEIVETNILNRIPGYTILRGLTKRFSGIEENALFAVATIAIADNGVHMLGFIVDEHKNGDYTVLIPNAPTPNVGVIYYVKRERVTKLDVPLVKAVNCIMQWGVESQELFKTLSQAPSVGSTERPVAPGNDRK